MAKTLTILLATTPYTFENTHTAIRLAEAALEKGYKVNLFATADGTHNFTSGQKAKGVPNAEAEFSSLMGKGLHVELCGSCLNTRGIGKGDLMEGAEPSSMKNLFKLVRESDAFISLTF